MPAAKRTKEPPPPPPLLEITALIEIQQPLTLVADGRKRKHASAFHVLVRSDAFGGVEECFLKIFPADTANTVAFEAECAANHALNVAEGLQNEDAGTPLDALKSLLQLAARALPWPLCYGRVAVADPFFVAPRARPSKRQPEPTAPTLHALLFQFLPGLVLCAPEHLADDDAGPGTMQAQLLAALARVHAAGVLHRDLEDRALWPAAALRNVYVRESGTPVILDFDRARVVPEGHRDAGRLDEEEAEMRALIARAVEGRGREPGWGMSREARRLL
ncbi:hypothetical protein FB451DRAFT_1470713 [Mycena latifolia]|nr:hypothetical protein FB451DRAFT_1470713 [Mycena latifolia]